MLLDDALNLSSIQVFARISFFARQMLILKIQQVVEKSNCNHGIGCSSKAGLSGGGLSC